MLDESGDNLDGIDEAQLISLLKEVGLDNPATQLLLNAWYDQIEAEADAVVRGKGPLAEEAWVNLELRKAELYSQADSNQEARDCATFAWMDAYRFAQATCKDSLIIRVQATAAKRGYTV